MTDLAIKICPTCGSKRIRRVKRDIQSKYHGQAFTARGIQIEECPVCGERLFGPAALDEIAAQRPKSAKVAAQRKSA